MKNFEMSYSCASDIGMRMSNQDNYMIEGAPAFRNAAEYHSGCGLLDTGSTQVLCVCDGVGGGSRGDHASLTALDAIARTIREPAVQALPLAQVLEQAAEAAQKAVIAAFLRELRPGGCTLVMLGVRGDEWAFLNIGDSPAFLLRAESGELEELSVRHNLEWEKRRRGETPDANDGCYLLHYIGRAGYTAAEQAATAAGTLRAGDALLLCSDGVTNAFTMEELTAAIAAGTDAAGLVEKAAAVYGADNSTAICLHLREKEPAC